MTYPYEFALFAERNRNRLYDVVIKAIERAAAKDGITQSQIADAIGRKRSQVSAWLSGPSNWTCDTTSDLLRAIKAEMEYRVIFDEDKSASNIHHPASDAPSEIRNAQRQARTVSSTETKNLHIRINGNQSLPIPVANTNGMPVARLSHE